MAYLDHTGLAYLWEKLKVQFAGKQDKLTGTSGQVVGFDASGNAVAQDGGGTKTYRHLFAASDWSGTSEMTLTIPAATHGISGSDVLCKAAVLSGTSYVEGTWAALATYATIDGTSREITLHASSAYAGAVLLVG